MGISILRVGQGLANKKYQPQLCIPTFFKQGDTHCYIRGCLVEIESIAGFWAHKNRGLYQVLLDFYECPIAFLIPFTPVGSSQGSEEGFQTILEPGNKTPKSGQPADQLLDPLLGAGGLRLQDGLKLHKISLYPLVSYHEAKESPGADPEGTFLGV